MSGAGSSLSLCAPPAPKNYGESQDPNDDRVGRRLGHCAGGDHRDCAGRVETGSVPTESFAERSEVEGIEGAGGGGVVEQIEAITGGGSEIIDEAHVENAAEGEVAVTIDVDGVVLGAAGEAADFEVESAVEFRAAAEGHEARGVSGGEGGARIERERTGERTGAGERRAGLHGDLAGAKCAAGGVGEVERAVADRSCAGVGIGAG